jgi:hypothetical protein
LKVSKGFFNNLLGRNKQNRSMKCPPKFCVNRIRSDAGHAWSPLEILRQRTPLQSAHIEHIRSSEHRHQFTLIARNRELSS